MKILFKWYFGSNSVRLSRKGQEFDGILWLLNGAYIFATVVVVLITYWEILNLRSERTLRDYTHFNSTGAGFSDATDHQLKEHAKLDKSPNHKNLVGLLCDEIHIKKGLVCDKNTGNLIGFLDLGNVNNELLRYSNSDSGGESKLPLAKSVMFIMVRGLTSGFHFPYAQFPADSIKGSQLFLLFWKAVHRLEFMGFCVLSCTCDGATSNRRLYHLYLQNHNLTNTKYLTNTVRTTGTYTWSVTRLTSLRRFKTAFRQGLVGWVHV